MEKILGTIITIILIFYVIRLIGALLLPLIIKHFFKKMQNNFDANFTNFQSADDEVKNEGDVSVEYSDRKKNGSGSISDDLGGEYVDYEEVK